MRNYLLAATAAMALAIPGIALADGPYVGVEGGVMFPRSSPYNVNSTATTTTTPPGGTATTATTTSSTSRGFIADYKNGADLDAIAGYDFGMFRLEGEFGYKRTKLKSFTADPTLLTAINTAPIAGVTSGSFGFGNRTTVLSGMANALVSVPVGGGVKVYGGGGFGRARVKTLDQRDNAWAWQLIGGISTAISPNVDLGLKYRYFQTGKLNLADSATFTGVDPVSGNSVSSAYGFTSNGKFRSHSLLASLTYNFGAKEAAAPPPPVVEAPPPPPPPPPPPATQTCPDGSVILATDPCPAPPPPPPPPPPPAKGERG